MDSQKAHVPLRFQKTQTENRKSFRLPSGFLSVPSRVSGLVPTRARTMVIVENGMQRRQFLASLSCTPKSFMQALKT